ncbi:MAG: PAS domain-containing protein [Clostridiales bacterium]|nr:PAS domain-containing protein [Clostridiales bacterium]MDU3242144.1 PAS domain-containing protein [Clostridiales bacterium]
MKDRIITEVKQFAHWILQKHYVENDEDAVTAVFAPNITWIGAGEDQHGSSREETAEYFQRFQGKIPPCHIWDEEFEVTELGTGVYLCSGLFWVAANDDTGLCIEEHQRISFIFQRKNDTFECVHIHNSNPYQKMESNDLFPNEEGRKAFSSLEKKMAEMEEKLSNKEREFQKAVHAQKQTYEEYMQKNHQIQVVLDAIQGGLKISIDDDMYTYAYVSDELCSMFGYTREEFMEVTKGSAVGAVYPEDLPRVLKECEEAFRDGSMDYAIKYRIACRDGSLKWIIDSGKKVKNEDGQIIINSIYLDVTEMEEANQKMASQKDLLDSIYDSMMCGIIRYQLKDGEFSALTLNHEALRILGYESEEVCHELGVAEFYNRIHEDDRQTILDKINQLKNPGDRFQFEYRIQGSSSEILWVYGTTELMMSSTGGNVIQRVMVDITEKKKLELELEEEHQRFRIAIESSPAVIFEYDVREDQYRAYGTLSEKRGKNVTEEIVPHFLKKELCSLVAKKDAAILRDFMLGRSGKEIEIQMAPHVGSSHTVWSRISGTTIYDEDGKLVKMIGKMRSIQSEKEKEFALEEAKYRDGLTGLYTKEAGIRLVREYMELKSPDEICGLMLLDMDNFQKVNDEEGSVFADAILQEVAVILKSETQADDILIRLGGDEFMLFLKGCTKGRATILGPKIASMVQNLVVSGQSKVRVSVTIGMCVTEVVDEYSGLYRCAESTLKYAKENERGHACCYLDTSNELGTVLTELYKEAHFINEIGRPVKYREEDLTSFALELLGKAKSLDDAIFLLLSRIGKTYHFDRVTILEMDYEYLSYRYTYQWAGNPSDLEMDRDFYLLREDVSRIDQLFDEEGLCDRMNPRVSQIPSCLISAIWNHGKVTGTLSFESRTEQYIWTKEQRKLVKEMAKIIFSFIMKARADAVSQAKTDFLSRMSHEIRTPMNAITGMTAIAKTVLDNKEKALDCLNKIESANTYLLNLVNDVLDMSRIESGKIELNEESMDLKRQIEDLQSLMMPQAIRKNIDFRMENNYTSNCRIVADELRLNQVLVNIVGNALKFTGNGGQVLVHIDSLQEDSNQVTLRFSVKDNGIGINREALGRIFTAFEQEGKKTSSKYGGTGLGLAISSRLVQMMGGNLEVESKPGEGSLFYFTLTFPYGEDTVIPNEAEVERDYDFNGKRILLAEDNELNQEIALTILEMKGFMIEAVEDGQQAVDMYMTHPPYYYHAVLMDIRMPVMDGLEATKWIRTSGREDARTIPIIAMTANAFSEDTKKSMASGMNGHLSKPIETEVLFDTLQKCLKGS